MFFKKKKKKSFFFLLLGITIVCLQNRAGFYNSLTQYHHWSAKDLCTPRRDLISLSCKLMTSPPSAFLASNTGFEYHGEENGKKKKKTMEKALLKNNG